MKDVPHTYKVSKQTANIMVDAFDNMTRNPATINTTDRNIDLTFETFSFGGNEKPKAVLKGRYHDRWGERPCLYLKDLKGVYIEDDVLVVEADGVQVRLDTE